MFNYSKKLLHGQGLKHPAKLNAKECVNMNLLKLPKPQLPRKAPMSADNPKEKFKLPKRYGVAEKSVWEIYRALAYKYKPVNLGSGFPNFAPPKLLRKAFSDAVNSNDFGMHQYTDDYGHPRLVNALANLYSPKLGQKIDPANEIVISVGCCGALMTTLQGHIEQGDEVIIVEPSFDCYNPMVRFAGGIPKVIPLKPINEADSYDASKWSLDFNELECMFNEKTKIFLFNNPHNPTGKVYTLEELECISELCKKYNTLCVSDEVYEWFTYPPKKFVNIASLPGMWERTITCSTAGKIFFCTGYKTGWALGPAHLIHNLQTVHQYGINCFVTPLQEAVGVAIEHEVANMGKDNSHFVRANKLVQCKMSYVVKSLQEIGFKPVVPEAGIFLLVDWTPKAKYVDLSKETEPYIDLKFTQWMIKNVGLLTIPPSAFYSKENKCLADKYFRLCIIKDDDTITKAMDVLRKFFSKK